VTAATEAAAATGPEHGTEIRIEGLSKSFDTKRGSLTAIDDLSLTIEAGSFFVVVGPSGCGKSTLLRLLAGLEKPSAGLAEIHGGGSGRPASSMVFQGESAFPWMTVFDNAAYGLRMRRVPAPERREIVAQWLAKIGLSDFADAYPHELSGGMKQRVALARAFANDPDVLLMDEPFSALDELTKTVLQQELLRIWGESSKTVVFITHSVDEAVTLGDRILVMTARPGREKAMFDVPFERPRDVLELRKRPEYGELVYRIWESLSPEVEGGPR
jgi:NitT/TauT family transport system ATP-binding protein